MVEEIQCEEADDDDMKYMQEAIDLWGKSRDKKTKVVSHLSICTLVASLQHIVQVGSVLVHPQNGVIGRGHNRMPLCRGQELDCPWTSDGDKSSLNTKYPYGRELNDHGLLVTSTPLFQWSTRQ